MKKIPLPEERKRPQRYKATELRAMLVADGVARRPLGGGGPAGLAWMTTAIAHIARKERKSQETVFAEIRGEITAETGLDLLALG